MTRHNRWPKTARMSRSSSLSVRLLPPTVANLPNRHRLRRYDTWPTPLDIPAGLFCILLPRFRDSYTELLGELVSARLPGVFVRLISGMFRKAFLLLVEFHS